MAFLLWLYTNGSCVIVIGVLKIDTENSDSEQDSEPELLEDVIEPQPSTSSTRYAVPEGPNGRPGIYFN